MAESRLGTLIKDARTAAGLTQEQLARKIPGVSAADISKAERGGSTLTQDQLKLLAKATGITQKSLLDAAKAEASGKAAKPTTSTSTARTSGSKTGAAAKTGTAAKTSSAKTGAAKTGTAAKTSSAKTGAAKTGTAAKTSSAKTGTAAKTSAPKTPANANSTMKVTAAERKLVESYRTATAAQKKAAAKLLKGEADAQLDAINGTSAAAGVAGDLIQNAISGLAESIFGGKK